MKKIILFLILVNVLNFGFSEKGYDGAQWFTNKEFIDFKDLSEWQIDTDASVYFCETIALGDSTVKSFIIQNNNLAGVSYLIPANRVEELTRKLGETNKLREIKTELFSKKDVTDKLKEFKTLPETIKSETKAFIIISEYYLWQIGNYCERMGYMNIPQKTDDKDSVGTLYIYDYNDDTRIYISVGNVGNFAFVAYVPHHKDY